MMDDLKAVAAAVTYHSGKDKFLILKQSDSVDVFPDRWEFPSGKIEDETSEKTALRELREETGLLGQFMKSGDSFVVESEYKDFEVHPFLVMVDDDKVELGSEHSEYRCVDIPEIQDLETVKGLEKDLENVGVLDG